MTFEENKKQVTQQRVRMGRLIFQKPIFDGFEVDTKKSEIREIKNEN